MFQNPPSQMPAAPQPPAGAAPGSATVFACIAPGPDALAHYNARLGFAPGALPVSAHYLPAQLAHGDGRRYARVPGDWNPVHLAGPAARAWCRSRATWSLRRPERIAIEKVLRNAATMVF